LRDLEGVRVTKVRRVFGKVNLRGSKRWQDKKPCGDGFLRKSCLTREGERGKSNGRHRGENRESGQLVKN